MGKKLRIALEDLRWAFDDQSGEYSWVLDTETGEVLRLQLVPGRDAPRHRT